MSAPAQRPHGLGETAIEIADPDWASAFVVIGENVHFAQPRPTDVDAPDAGLTILGHTAALKLADTIARALRPTEAALAAVRRQEGLSVEIIDERLVVSIGIDALMTAVRGADFWDDDELVIVDPNVLAADIVHELVREQDDGTTPVHLMIDAAVEEAIDQGSLGVREANEVDDEEVGDDV